LNDLADAGEAVVHFVRFWGAVFRPDDRARLADAWERSGVVAKGWMVLEGIISAAVGLGIPALLVWVIFS
jgi:hypothetical protein